jgi:hypothetical protein
MSGMRVAVVGEGWSDGVVVGEVLRALELAYGFVLVSGNVKGADRWALRWCEGRGVEVEVERVDWAKWGKHGMRMWAEAFVERLRPDVVVVFPGGGMTGEVVRRAEAAGVRVWAPEVGGER